MSSNLTCFKCWKDTATLTYEENRIYKVSCECGCSYDFRHCSMDDAEQYHLKMLELYGEIDRSAALKAENTRLRAERDAAAEDLEQIIRADDPCAYRKKNPCNIPVSCQREAYKNFEWRGLEAQNG